MRTATLAEVRLKAGLLDQCIEHQGQFLDTHHPATSFATKYGFRFVESTSALCDLYRSQGFASLDAKLAEVFQAAGVLSCRGELMTEAKVKYLLDAYNLR